MKTGTVKLIYKGEVNNQENYTCLTQRNQIIEKWRKLYGEYFEECQIQIRPDIKQEKL